jgi:hypothetical protein
MLYKISGPPALAALHVPAQEPTLVIVESFSNPAQIVTDAEQISQFVTVQLKNHQVAPMIDAEEFYKLRSSRREEIAKMTISQIGRALAVKQVIYVDLQECIVETVPGTGMLRGCINASVRVIDAESGSLRWPISATQGYAVVVETPYVQKSGNVNEDFVRNQMDAALARKIARLFYQYKPDEPD